MVKKTFVVTGSSSFDMANEINESATGRLIEYNLYPFSLAELAADTSVITEPGDAKRTLTSLTNNYLYKDLFSYKGLKKPDVIQKLVRALALQLGSEVSYNELSNLLGIDKETVENYICLLEKCFVVFRLDSFSRNLRNEIKKGKKIYFYDNGIRNAVISNFAPLELRTDAGALEFKWNAKAKSKQPKVFMESYPNSVYEIITPENFWSFVR